MPMPMLRGWHNDDFIGRYSIEISLSLLLIDLTKFEPWVYKNLTTLVYLIIVQNGINVQAGKFPKINKRAGCNKTMQVGISQKINKNMPHVY